MTDPVAAWHAEHVYFSQLLRLLQREVELFHRAAQPNYELMLDIISYLRDYCDQFHHRREDEAFARLTRHRPELAPALARLQQEHRVIAHAGETLRQRLSDVLAGSVVARGEVEVAAATYLVYYGNHIAKEEEDVMAQAATHLTPADWQAVKDVAPAASDPVFGDRPEERFRELRRQIALEASPL